MKFMVIIACAMSLSLRAMDQGPEKRSNYFELVKLIAIKSTVFVPGAVEVIVDQPLITLKNYLQEKRKNPNAKAPKNIKDFYRGFNANMLGMVPTTALQMMAYDKVNSLIESDSSYKSWAPVAAGGFAGALAASPIELVIIRQHKDQIPLLKALKSIVQEHGVSKLARRGLAATTLRDIGFTKGFLDGHQWAKEQLIAYVPSMPVGAASLISGMGIGATVAVATHPFDTIKYKQQSFAARTMYDACRMIYQEGGVIAFWDGVLPRSTRVMLAIMVMSETLEKLNNLISDKP